jgi:WD40 repeat protein
VSDATLRLRLRGDLDWIAMRAMEKDRARRYQTVAELLQDIVAHCQHRPIAAAPPGVGYWVHKFCRRHRLAVALAACVVGAGAIGVTSTLVALGRATRNRIVAERASQQAELDAYAANIRAAESALEAGDVQRAGAALAATNPASRGIEWEILHARCDESAGVLQGHSGRVIGAVYAPDGQTLLSWDASGGVMLWRGETGTALQRHKGEIRRAVFTADSRRVVTTALDSTVVMHDVATGAVVASMVGHGGGVEDVCVSPDGELIATVSRDGTAMIWVAEDGRALQRIVCSAQLVRCCVFSRDGRLLATGGDDGTARVWNPRDGELIATINGSPNAAVMAIDFDRDAARIAIAMDDGQLVLSDVKTQTGEVMWKASRNLHDCEFSPDGSRLAATSASGEVVLCKLDEAGEVTALRGHTQSVYSCRFSTDGDLLVTASGDGVARVWDSSTGDVRQELRGHAGAVWMVAFRPGTHDLATTGSDETVRLWSHVGSSRSRLVGHRHVLRDVQMSRDSTRVWTTALDGTARQWDVRTGTEQLRLTHESVEPLGVYRSLLSPDERTVLTTGQNGLARLWNADDGSLVATLRGHEAAVMHGEFVDHGRKVLTGSYDGTLRWWDARDGREIAVARAHEGRMRELAISRDGELVASAGDDAMVRVWRASSGEQVHVLEGHSRAVLCAEFSPDGRQLATAGDDRAVMLWNVENGRIVAKGLGHEGAVRALRWTHDGRCVVSGSADMTLRVWNANTGEPITTLTGHGDVVRAIEIVGDDRIVSGANDGTIRVWSMEAQRELTTIASGLGAVSRVALSPDGTYLIASCNDWAARVFDTKRFNERQGAKD